MTYPVGWRAAAARACLVGALSIGCREEVSAETRTPRPASSPTAPPSGAPAAPPAMAVSVTEVRAPGADGGGIRSVLRGAETAFLSCLEPGASTGVLALRFPIDRGGAVGEVTQLPETTYGGEDARDCIARIVAAMRFPGLGARGEVEVTLEVGPRY